MVAAEAAAAAAASSRTVLSPWLSPPPKLTVRRIRRRSNARTMGAKARGRNAASVRILGGPRGSQRR